MAEKKRILILGGGYGGVWSGKILEKQYRKRDDVEITLVDMRPFHTLMTELHEVAGWRTEPDAVQVSFRKIFGAKKINVVVDKIEKVDFEAKKATSALNVYPFDYIVVGVGAEPEFFGIPGVQENSFTLWSFEDAMRIRNHLEHSFAKAAKEPDAAKRRKILTFVVAGAGFTGIEMIGELLEYRDEMCRKHFIDPKETRVINIEALPSILPILEEPLRAKAEKYLQKKGCEIMLGAAIIGAEPGKVLLKSGAIVETETFIWTCGVKGANFAGSLALPQGKRNRIECDQEMKSPKYPFAYVVGDNAGLMVSEKPMAQIVESAHFTAEAAAKNIIADIDGGARHTFHANYHGFMVSLGGRYGVANAGGIKSSGFVAMAMKHMINMYYLFMIAGFNQVWEYFKHEFLDMKKRSIVGGFLSHKTRSYWPLLLRMWLGFMWFVEGANKISEGWLNFSDGKSRSAWLFSKGVVQAGIKATEAVSSATAAVGAAAAGAADATTAASAAAGWDVATTAAGTAAAAAGPWFDPTAIIFKPDGLIATWFRTTFMDGMMAYLPYSGLQLMIVVMELAIGLAIFGGCFTWFAAAASLVMCVIFTLSGMFSWDRLWFFFAGILMLGGAGRAFGMDYWVVPFFKKWWNGTKFARKWHFYADDPAK
jgi:NADH dehydrogenase